ncbi:hypothetical protein P4S72_15035 [Vibrio sp. PP-XX7]
MTVIAKHIAKKQGSALSDISEASDINELSNNRRGGSENSVLSASPIADQPPRKKSRPVIQARV